MNRLILTKWTAAMIKRPLFWVVLSSLLVGVDYLTGEAIQFPIAFVLPVMFMAWYLRERWAVTFALALPLTRLLMVLKWDGTWLPPGYALVNMLIRILVLLTIAILVWRYREAEKELKVLRGVLRVCMHCKKIKDENQHWQQLEYYISEHSEADFSHSLCPDCARKHYPEVFGR